MNARPVEAGNALDSSCKAGIVGLIQDVFHVGRISEPVHHPGNEVAAQAVSCGVVEHEFGRHKGTVHDASAASSAGDVEGVLLRRGDDKFAIATEASLGVENLDVKDAVGVLVLRLGIERPVPVAKDRGQPAIHQPDFCRIFQILTAARPCSRTPPSEPSHTRLRNSDAR